MKENKKRQKKGREKGKPGRTKGNTETCFKTQNQRKNKPPKKTQQNQKQTNKNKEGPGPNEVAREKQKHTHTHTHKTTNPTCPQQKTISVQIWAHNPKRVQMIFLTIFACMRNILCFLHLNKYLFNLPFFERQQSKIAQVCVLPILTRQSNTHECTPLNKNEPIFC